MLLGQRHLHSIIPVLLQLKPKLKPTWIQVSPLLPIIVSRLKLNYLKRIPTLVINDDSHCSHCSVPLFAITGPGLVSGQGLQVRDGTGETKRIHEENQAKLQAMSQTEILEEQRKLLSQLGRQSCLLLAVIRISRVRTEHCPPWDSWALKSAVTDCSPFLQKYFLLVDHYKYLSW